MSRTESPYVVGEFWLDKRRDGKSTNWQITNYKAGTRQIVYRSTHTTCLDEAKSLIDAHHSEHQAKQPQEAHDARVIPLMMTYWTERGKKAVKPDQIASSLRQFIGFLEQDEAGFNAVVTDLTPSLFERFREWRMGPHQYSVSWRDQLYNHSSKGVKGESVQRNLDDIRAAIIHAEKNRRVPMAPKIPALEERYRSPARDNLLSIEQLGRIYWYSRHFPDMLRYFTLMLGTGTRPEAAAKFDASRQYDDSNGLIDTQNPDAPLTKKRNQFIPAIRPLRPILRAWAVDGATPAKSRKTAWRTMRAALGLTPETVAKDIRHTVATWLYSDHTVPERQTSELLGHAGHLARTTKNYAKYRPDRLKDATRSLSTLWLAVSREARAYGAVHLLSTVGQNSKITVAKRGEKCKDLCQKSMVGGDGLEPPTLSV